MMKTNFYIKLLSAAILVSSFTGMDVTAKIKVGVAETVITPPNPVGVAMAGYDRGKNTSTGVHDDLFARSIVVEGADGTSVAIITVAEYIEGGYAVNGSPYAPQAEQAIIDASMELISRVK